MLFLRNLELSEVNTMAVSRQELMAWFREGVEQKATHMIVVCDTFDWEDYPAYVMEGEDVREREKKFQVQGNMQRVMEVYDLRKDMESQMRPGTRVFNY